MNHKEIICNASNSILPNKLFSSSGGAFILLGLLIGILNALKRGEE